jgi:hypothetical protein
MIYNESFQLEVKFGMKIVYTDAYRFYIKNFSYV